MTPYVRIGMKLDAAMNEAPSMSVFFEALADVLDERSTMFIFKPLQARYSLWATAIRELSR